MDWHPRFLQQAAWTRSMRRYLLGKAGLEEARRVLEVGCGTGAVLADLAASAAVHGLDLDAGRLLEARRHLPGLLLACGDALALPYAPGIFDIVFCHFLLLWVEDPLQSLLEMKRVTRSGGSVLALAEPDYDSRLDEPAELSLLGRWQAEALRRQGADPSLGRRLADLFHQAGIGLLETGMYQPPERGWLTPEEYQSEWAVLEADLMGFVPADELQRMKMLDEQAWKRGKRRLHVPTYFAHGIVL